MGHIFVKGLESDGGIDIANTTGSIEGSIVGTKSDYTITSTSTAGSCNLENSTGGSHKLTFENMLDQTELHDFVAALTGAYVDKHFVSKQKGD